MQFESADMEQFLRLFYVETLRIVRGLSIPVIAAVHGYVREGACTLAFRLRHGYRRGRCRLWLPRRAQSSRPAWHARLVPTATDRENARCGAYLHRGAY